MRKRDRERQRRAANAQRLRLGLPPIPCERDARLCRPPVFSAAEPDFDGLTDFDADGLTDFDADAVARICAAPLPFDESVLAEQAALDDALDDAGE